ncbi:MAG: hypothetical protein AAGF92_17240 [Myxococcota bacterium]
MNLLLQFATTWAMTGIIWFVQLVQYPSFGEVDAASFPSFHAHHSTTITPIVAPLMIVEAFTAVTLFWASEGIPRWQLWFGLGLVVLAWASTFFLQVPLHQRLGGGFDSQAWQALVRTNWVRTFAWSARAALVSYWVARALRDV